VTGFRQGAEVTDLHVADRIGALREESELGSNQLRRRHPIMRNRSAEYDLAALLGNLADLTDPRDVDQMRRLRKPQLPYRQKAVATGKEAGIVAEYAIKKGSRPNPSTSS
jgi:hypothetical protein